MQHKGKDKTKTLRLPRDLLDQVNALGDGADNHYKLQLKGGAGRRTSHNIKHNNIIVSRKDRRKNERATSKNRAAGSRSDLPDSQAKRPRLSDSRPSSSQPKSKKPERKTTDQLEQPPKSILRNPKSEPKVNSSPSSYAAFGPSVHATATADAEIAYYEKKLKLKKKELPKSFADDGLDFLLEGLEDDYLEDASLEPRGKKRKRSAGEPKITEAREQGKGRAATKDSQYEDGGSDNEGSSVASDFDSDFGLGMNDDEETGTDNSDDVEEEFHGFSSKKSGGGEKGLDDDGPPADAGSVKNLSEPVKPIGRYVPPKLRNAPSSNGEFLVMLQRKVQGQVNRLTEANMLQILSSIEELYRGYPRHDVTSTLTDVIVASIGDRSTLMDTFMILHAGFISAMYKVIGTDFGAHVVQTVVENFESHYAKCNKSSITQEEALGAQGKEAINLMGFLAELLNYGVVGSSLLFDYIRLFVAEVTELNTELLLRIVRTSGQQLRQDDPTALKSMVVMLQPALAKAGDLSARTKFMVETLNNLKHNRIKTLTSTSEVSSRAAVQMKKQLGLLNSRHLRATEPLRPTLRDIKEVETRGKWWLVGASWRNNVDDAEAGNGPGLTIGDVEYDQQDNIIDTSGDFVAPDLLQLAREQRMNTEVRRAIFVAIMSSTDFKDAVARLQKLRLKRSQEREIPRVLVHCCGSEENYNHFYTLVSAELCSTHSIKMAFQFCLWELFRGFGDGDAFQEPDSLEDDEDNSDEDDGSDDDVKTRKAVKFKGTISKDIKPEETTKSLKKILNLAKLYGHLIGNGVLPLTVLKILNFYSLQPSTKDLLEVLFFTVFQVNLRVIHDQPKVNDKKLNTVFYIKGMSELARGLDYFLSKHARLTELGGTSKERKLVKKSCVRAKRVLQSIAVAE